MRRLVGITGTTSVGKSEAAVHLAKLMHTEIVSADSMQVYKGMDIGTAKITREQMQCVPHHMIDVAEPNREYSAFLYREQAAAEIDKIVGIPIVVGGTAFYFDSLVYPPEYGEPNPERHRELQKLFWEQGIEALQNILFQIDGDAAKVVDLNNYKRVIRAIEIAENGQSRARGNSKNQARYDLILFVLQRNREDLFRQIDMRVDNMIKEGLVEEVRSLIKGYGVISTPSFEAIGYKEIVRYLQGECTLQEAIELIKINTRHYAKRQISYFKRMNVACHIDVEGKTSEDIAGQIFNWLNEHGVND